MGWSGNMMVSALRPVSAGGAGAAVAAAAVAVAAGVAVGAAVAAVAAGSGVGAGVALPVQPVKMSAAAVSTAAKAASLLRFNNYIPPLKNKKFKTRGL